jgi:hypothetical protein
MKETKFTPGPWVIDWNVSKLDLYGADERTIVATVQRSMMSPAIDSAAIANARLIRAAPKLYNVLAELEESAEYWGQYYVPLGIVDRIKEALASVRGEQ